MQVRDILIHTVMYQILICLSTANNHQRRRSPVGGGNAPINWFVHHQLHPEKKGKGRWFLVTAGCCGEEANAGELSALLALLLLEMPLFVSSVTLFIGKQTVTRRVVINLNVTSEYHGSWLMLG